MTTRKLPRIGGVIATYNQERFAAAAVTSLASQVDEIVVVDDASTDGTVQELNRINLPNLKLISLQDNVGVSEAFNMAAAELRSDILLIQGGDDLSLPLRGKRQTQVLAEGAIALTYSSPAIIDSNDNLLDNEVAGEFDYSGTRTNSSKDLFFGGNFICAPSVGMWRRDYLEWGGFDPNSVHHQDYGLWLRAAASGTIHRAQHPVVRYRKHSTNLSRHSRPGEARHTRKLRDLADTLGGFVSWADERTLRNLVLGAPAAPLVRTNTTRELLAALALLYHRESAVVRIGLEMLTSAIGTPNPTVKELDSFGLSMQDYLRWQSKALATIRRKEKY